MPRPKGGRTVAQALRYLKAWEDAEQVPLRKADRRLAFMLLYAAFIENDPRPLETAEARFLKSSYYKKLLVAQEEYDEFFMQVAKKAAGRVEAESGVEADSDRKAKRAAAL
jgi:hypothetical protein